MTSTTNNAALTFRALVLGVTGVLLICGLTPFNNLVVNNTDFIGNHFPAGVLLLVLLVAVGINAPLSRFVPRFALRRDELLVMLSMWLIASAIPYVGLNRYFPGHLAAFWVHAADQPQYADLMRQLNLSDWLFPTVDSTDPAARGLDAINRGYFQRLSADRSTFVGRVHAVPWSAWTTPAFAWGIFIVALMGMGLFITLLWHRQWTEVERLPFPLASVYLSLIEPPAAGRWLSAALRDPMLWISACAVFALHGFNGAMLYRYGPGNGAAPYVPLSFNLSSIFAETPLRYASGTLFQQRIFFTIIGLMFFVRTNIAFSLWFFYMMGNLARATVATGGGEISGGMIADQILGAATMLAAWILFTSRRHLWQTIRSTWVGVRNADERLERILGVGVLACMATMLVWLMCAGASVPGAIVITGGLAALALLLARVIAETGLLYVLLPIEMHRAWLFLLPTQPGASGGLRTTLPSYFFASVFDGIATHDTRQSLPGFASTAAKLTDETNDGRPIFGQRLRIVGVMLATIVIAYVTAGASTLYVRYNYDTTMDSAAAQLDDGRNWGSYVMAQEFDLAWTHDYAPPRNGPAESHSRVGHFVGGAALTAALGAMRFRVAAWPLDPIGYLLCWTWGIGQIWASIFIGWTAKQLALWLAGAGGLQRLRGAFVGLIVGETLAVIFWLLIGLIRALMGLEYYAVQILPM